MERLRLSCGTELAFTTDGEASKPAVLLLHGTPNSSRMFREVAPALAEGSYVIAPDLPGHGESDALPEVSFAAIGQAISELLDHLGIGPRFIYLHDWGAPVGLQIAMQAPERVLGLIIQNATTHRTGWGPGWAETRAYWSQPNADNEAAATAHLTLAGTRDTYISGVPADVAERIPAEHWEQDWQVMNLPGHMETQRALIADYANYAARFDSIAEYLESWQPPALMIWGRHDVYFELAEMLSWMHVLPRMEAHVLDAGHLLLETHSDVAVSLMLDFIRRTQRLQRTRPVQTPRCGPVRRS